MAGCSISFKADAAFWPNSAGVLKKNKKTMCTTTLCTPHLNFENAEMQIKLKYSFDLERTPGFIFFCRVKPAVGSTMPSKTVMNSGKKKKKKQILAKKIKKYSLSFDK